MKLTQGIFLFFVISTACADEASNACNLVAVVFDTEICKQEIEEESERLKQRHNAEELLKRERDRLASRIWTIGIDRLIGKETYTPTQDEIDSYLSFIRKSEIARQQRNKKSADTIRNLLETYEYEEQDRIQLEKALENHEYQLKEKERDEDWNKGFYADIEKRFGRKAAMEMRQQAEERKKQIPLRLAETMIAKWKINKALHDKYGGRIIFQQFGIEPIDAFQSLIEEIKTTGKLKILKPEYANIFSDQEAYNQSSSHSFTAEDAFSRPYWEDGMENESDERAIQAYKAIPHK